MTIQKLSIWATPGHTSITIQNGASRETTGKDFPAVAAAMHPADRATLAQFCAGILATLDATAAALDTGGK